MSHTRYHSINTYRVNIYLFIGGGGGGGGGQSCLKGDPLSMAMCEISTIPLICQLSHENIGQVWYADDASAGGRLQSIRMWWDKLVQHGPAYGYLPNASKSWLIVKDAKHSEAHAVFQGSGVPITNITLGMQLGLNRLSILMSVKKFLNGSLRLSFYLRYH